MVFCYIKTFISVTEINYQNILSIDGFERIHPYQLNGSCGIELSSIFVIVLRTFLYPRVLMAMAARGPDPQVVKVMTERMAVVSALPEEK